MGWGLGGECGQLSNVEPIGVASGAGQDTTGPT